MKQAWLRWVAFLHEVERPHALAALRITFGLALVINVGQQLLSGDVVEMYAEIEHGGAFGFRYNNSPYTLFRFIPMTVAGVYAVVVAQFVGALLLTAGLYTRAAAIVCWAAQVTLFDRMVLYRYDGDNVYRVVLALMCVVPAGAAWSLDARWRGKARRVIPRWCRRLFVLQLAIIYTRTGIVKTGSSWSILEGWSAVYLAVNLPGIARWNGDWAGHPLVYPLTQIGTFVASWWEILFFLLPLNIYLRRNRRTRRHVPRLRPWAWLRRWLGRMDLRAIFLATGVLMHGTLLVITDVGFFSVMMMSLYTAYLHPHEVRRAWKRLRAVAGGTRSVAMANPIAGGAGGPSP